MNIRRFVAAAVLLGALIPFPAAVEASAATAPAASDSLWNSEAAAADSLSRYWQRLDRDWYEPLTPAALEFGLDESRLDSLAEAGDAEIGRLITGRIVRVDYDLIGPFIYNRVEGWRPNLGLTFTRPGWSTARLDNRLGYGVSSKRFVHHHELDLPLLSIEPRGPAGVLLERPWPWLGLVARGGRDVKRYAGDLQDQRDYAAFFSGEDPNHYYQDAFWETGLVLRPRPSVRLELGGGHHRHKALPVHTRWNVYGEEDEVPDNLPVPELRARTLYAGLTLARGHSMLTSRIDWRRTTGQSDPVAGVAGDGPAWYRRLAVYGRNGTYLPGGHEFVLQGRWTSTDRTAPPQWKTWLGDYGTLRGYEAAEISGDSGGAASADLRLGWDLFHALRFPMLKNWRLQPLLFADYGKTFVVGDAAPCDRPDWRADVGFGFGRAVLGSNLRFYLAKPVGHGHGGRGWRLTVGFED